MKCKTFNRKQRAFVASALLVSAMILAVPMSATAQLVSGLQGAQGSTLGPDGAIYVTEGAAGRLTRVDPATGATSTVASGLPPSLIGIGGAVDVAYIDDTAYVLVTLVGDPLFGAPAIDGIYRVDGPTSFTLIADLGSWSADNPPTGFDFFLVNGVQYSLEAFRGGLLVTDGHHNRVLWVSLDGEISEFATFGNTVPTGLEVQGNTVYMAELGPAPNNPEDGKVVSISAKSGDVAEVAAGSRMAVDVEFGLGRTLYVLGQGVWDGAAEGSPAFPNTGSLARINANGTITELFTLLDRPTSMEFIGNTAYIVSLAGDIWVIPNVSPPPYGGSR